MRLYAVTVYTKLPGPGFDLRHTYCPSPVESRATGLEGLEAALDALVRVDLKAEQVAAVTYVDFDGTAEQVIARCLGADGGRLQPGRRHPMPFYRGTPAQAQELAAAVAEDNGDTIPF